MKVVAKFCLVTANRMPPRPQYDQLWSDLTRDHQLGGMSIFLIGCRSIGLNERNMMVSISLLWDPWSEVIIKNARLEK